MSTNRLIRFAAATTMALSLSAPALAATTWDLPLAWPDGNFHVENAKRFAAEVNQATGGEVTINIHPGGSLGFKGPEMLTAVRDGLVPIGDVLLIQQVGEAPLMGLEAQPYLVGGFDDLETLHKHLMPALSDVAKDFNQKILYIVPWPRQYVYTKVPVKSIDDLKGIKIRTYNKSTTEMFNRVGMTSVQLPWGEVVPSLAAGTIDAVTTSASSGVDGKFWEFLKYMYPTSHVWSSNIVTVNLDAWNGLKPEHRDAIEGLAKKLQPEFWAVSRQEDEVKSKTLTDNGVIMGEVTDELRQSMQELTAPMVGEFTSAVGEPAGSIIEAYKKDVSSM